MAAGSNTDFALYQRLLRQARPYWLHIVGLFLLSLLSTPLSLLTPLPLKIAVDGVVGSQPLPGFLHALVPPGFTRFGPGVLAFAASLLVAVALLGQLQGLATTFLRAYTGERQVLDFRAQLFRHVQRLSLSYHDSKGTADSTYRIQYDAPAIQYITTEGFIPFVAAGFALVGMIYVTARIDWQLALVALAISPGLFLASRAYRRWLRSQSREVKKLESSALSVVQEVLGALRIVKAFGQEEREEERFLRYSSDGMRARVRLARIEGEFNVLVGLIASVGMAVVLFIGTYHVQAGVLTLGELLMVMGYLTQLYEPLKTVSRKAASLQSHLASAERAFALLDEAPDVAERPDAQPLSRASGAVAFRNVSFAYGHDRPVLQNISFEIAPGTRLGIAGATGAGKSTLISLLTRFYDPTAGQILLDGVDLREYRLDDLRVQFAIVLQEPVLFSASIAENIAYASPGASEQEIIAAAQAANAHEFIVRLPRGYETQVGERGVQLSGGQRQRIALARAFLKDSPVLILDEPTSAVDPETEAAIVDAMERLMRGRTVIVITHRPSMLTGCTALLVIENGRVIADTSRPAVPSEWVAGHTPLKDRRSSLLAHPAVRAWGQLRPERLEPERLRPLRVAPGKVRKTAVYRLEGVGPGGSSVIAKRCRKADALVERVVYEEVLPHLPLPALQYYGYLEERDGEYCWLFVEEASGEEYSHLLAEHRAHAARWLGLLHTSAEALAAKARLPDGGPGRYLGHLRSARDMILRHLANPVLTADDLAFLEAVLSRFDEVEANWGRLEEACGDIPRTLVHGDFIAKNMIIRSGKALPPLVAFDWEDAGWGVPAADLAQLVLPSSCISANPDVASYWSAVRDQWTSLDQDALQRVANCGTVFRSLAALQWESLTLAYEWVEWSLRDMRLCEAELAHALERLGWARRWEPKFRDSLPDRPQASVSLRGNPGVP